MQPQSRTAAWLPIALAILSSLVFAIWYLTTASPILNDQVASQKPVQAISTLALGERSVSPIPGAGYVGPDACASCHASRVAEFQTTRHFSANVAPSLPRMPQGFAPGNGVRVIPELSLRFEMTESNLGFFESAIRESDHGNEATSSAIAFCYGSGGGNDEVYFAWHEDRLYELPMVWLAALKTWGTSSFNPHGSGDYSRETTIRCIECHNTWFPRVPGSLNQYAIEGAHRAEHARSALEKSLPVHQRAILGVTCEVCHGPGRDHVEFHEHKPTAIEPQEIVRPALLSRERRMDLCAQCHSNALKHRGPDFRYRPGLPLEDFYVTFNAEHPEEDHVANQTTYLRRSRCFQNSETLTCMTCHNPHQPRSPTNGGAASCSSCHAPVDCKERDRLPAEVQHECIQCHMPERRKIQVYFRTDDDKYVAPVKRYEHRIGIYPEATNEVLLNWYRSRSDPESRDEAERLAKSLGESWRTEVDERQRGYRYLAAIDACRDVIRFDPDAAAKDLLKKLIDIQWEIDTTFQEALWHEQQRNYDRAIAAYQRILVLKPDQASAHGKLGTTFAAVGQNELAMKHWQAAERSDPNDPYAPAMLGWFAYLNGRADEALEHYRRAETIEPYRAKIHYQTGLALVKLGRLPEAAKRFEKAIEINPNDENAHRSLQQLSQQSERANQK